MPPAIPPTPSARETFREHIAVPIQIPAWGLLCMIAGAIFTSGSLYQKMDALVENSQKNDTQIAMIREKQIINTAILENLKATDSVFEQRMISVERTVFEQRNKR